MNIEREFAGTFIHYFIARDPFYAFLYAYGIRENKFGLVNIVRTGPIQEIKENILFTYGLFYKLGEVITAPEEKIIYLKMFAELTLPICDNELVGPSVILTMQ